MATGPLSPQDINDLREAVVLLRSEIALLKAYLAGELGGDGRAGNVHRLIEKLVLDIGKFDGTLGNFDKLLRGDGDKPGLLARLAALEKIEDIRGKREAAVVLAVILLAVNAVWAVIKRI